METNIRKNDKYVIVYFRDDNCIVHDDDLFTKDEALEIAEMYIEFGLEILNTARGLK